MVFISNLKMYQWLLFASIVAIGFVIAVGVVLVNYYRVKKRKHCCEAVEFGSKLDAVDKVLLNPQATSNDLTKVVDDLEDLNVDYPDNSEVLWRLGEAHYKVSKLANDLDDRIKHIKRGIKTCQRASKLKRKLSVAQKWLVMLRKDENQNSIVENRKIERKGSSPSVMKDLISENSFDKIMAIVDEQFENTSNHSEVCNTVSLLQKLDHNNPEVLWRLAKAIYYVCLQLKSPNTKINNIIKGIKACEKAVDLNPELAKAHKWLAVLIGARAEQRHISMQFNDVLLLKKHLNIALKLAPNDHYLYYMLGRYDYWLAGLSSLFDREMNGLNFGDVAEPTYEEALVSLLKAEEMVEKPFKANHLMIAKCYIALKDYKIAIEWLERAKEISPKNYVEIFEDSKINAEIESLISDYKSCI